MYLNISIILKAAQKDVKKESPERESKNISIMASRIIAPSRKIVRQPNEFEKKFEERWKNSNKIFCSM